MDHADLAKCSLRGASLKGSSLVGTNLREADLSGGGINPGSYRLLIEVGAYFGGTPHLFETIALELQLSESRHYHVPLLIAPYSCTTYRGT